MNQKMNAPILLSAAVALALSGCAEKRSCATTVQAPRVVAPVVKSSTASTTDNRDSQIAALKAAIAEARNRTVEKVVTTPGSLYPPNASAGKCYARVLIPAKYEVTTEKILAKEASETLHVIPAKFQWVTKKVLVKEATEKIVAVPATYKTITEKIMLAPEDERIVPVPATYETITEKVLVREAHTAWRKGRGPVEKLDNATCEILCLVNVPARYKTVTRKVVKTPATTKSMAIAPVYKKVTHQAIDRPATTKIISIPAVYKTVKVKELVEAASVTRTPLPEAYKTVQKRVKIADSELKWQEVACKSAITRVNIKGVQKALKNSGFNPGPIDGIMGWRTKAALHKFQKSNGLSTGALTQETLATLGL